MDVMLEGHMSWQLLLRTADCIYQLAAQTRFISLLFLAVNGSSQH